MKWLSILLLLILPVFFTGIQAQIPARGGAAVSGNRTISTAASGLEETITLEFTIPDTVCVNQLIQPDPGTIAGTGFHWSFCSANLADPPDAESLGNPSNVLDDPKYISLIRNEDGCYAFLSNANDSSIVRIYFGSSFQQPPVSSESIHVSLLTQKVRGIQVLIENDIPLGFVVDGSMLYRFSFQGNTLAGVPQIVNDIPFPQVGASSALRIQKLETGWVGFVTDSEQNKVVRLRFPNQLSTSPQVDDLGNIGGLDGPAGLSMVTYNGQSYLFIANENNSTITRIDFGDSFLNDDPVGINLGNLNGLLDQITDLGILADCDAINGYAINHTNGSEELLHLSFPEGIEGTPEAFSLGTPGGLNEPFGLSSLLRVGDTIQAFISNSGDYTLTRLTFPTCSAASRPGDVVREPDPFYYQETGTFNIHLTWTAPDGAEQQQCQPVVVIPEISVDLGPDQTICEGATALLDAGNGFASYVWSTGATSQTIEVDTSGTFTVVVSNNWGCEAADSASVIVVDVIETTVDTLLCYGGRYWAQGAWQTTPGLYHDTLVSSAGCDSIVATTLGFKPRIPLDLGRDTIICPGEQILLKATVPGGSYLWQDGSTDSVYNVTKPGIYSVDVVVDSCLASDSVLVGDCPAKLWFPNAFTPNNDGLNDVFRPVGVSIASFRMVIFDRWGAQIYETTSVETGWDGTFKGEPAPGDTYTFIAYYETIENPGTKEKITGTFTLIK